MVQKQRVDSELEKQRVNSELEKQMMELMKMELDIKRAQLESRAGIVASIAGSDNEEEGESRMVHRYKGGFKGPKMSAFDDAKDDMDSYLHRFERYADAQKWND